MPNKYFEMEDVGVEGAWPVAKELIKHRELERLDRMEADAESALEHIRELRREYINQHNLNKGKP